MANNSFNVRVNVTDGGDVEKIKRALAGLGATVTSTRRNTENANKANNEFYDTQKKGIIGTANSTKSFSKLAETIGGQSSGIVGAYATLAANTFAVTAAFNALRGASQVEQIFRGLEAAGIRTGRSLTSTAQALKDVTGNAISTEQALRATAQITSAGFGSDAVERLGKAARDTSFALGRNMTDSLDRLSRGVVKLEPELLDELGIMTKLTESNTLYAQKLGKTEGQLTNFEKRQGFLNAVLTEAELKFGGLAEAAGDSTAYDKLAANFSDLTNTLLNGLNTIAKPLAGVLANSMGVLLGLGISFAASLRAQLLPGLLKTSAAATAQAAAYKELAKQKLEQVSLSRELALKENAAALASKKNFDFVGAAAPKAYKSVADSVRAGTATIEEQQKALTSLQRSQRQNEAILVQNAAYNVDPSKGAVTQKGLDKQQQVANTKAEIAAIRELQAAQTAAANADVSGNFRVQKAALEARVASRMALAQTASAASIGAASQLQLGNSWKQLVLSVKAYSSAEMLASGTALSNAQRVKAALFGVSTAAKAAGTAFLAALPYIGLIVTAVGLISSAISSLKSDTTKKIEAAFSDLSESTDKTSKYTAEMQRANESLAPAALRTAQVITIQSNALNELSEKFNTLLEATQEFNKGTKDTATGVAGFWEAFDSNSFASYTLGIDKSSKALQVFQKSLPSALNTGVNKDPILSGAIKTLDSLYKLAPRATAEAVKLAGGLDRISKLPLQKQIEVVRNIADTVTSKYGSAAQNVSALQESFKALEASISDFSLGSIINTKYDQVVKNLNSVSSAIIEFREASISSQEVDWTKLLSGVGAGMTKFLDVNTQKQLDQFRTADLTLQTLEKQRKSVGSLNQEDERRVESAQRLLGNSKQLLHNIEEQVYSGTELFKTAQRQEREYKAQLDLLNAHLSANQAIYAAAGAGLKARFAQEEKIRGIQAAQIKVELRIQEASIARAKLRAQELRDNNTLSVQKALQLRQETELMKKESERQLVAAKISVDNVERGQVRSNLYRSGAQGSELNEVDRQRAANAIDNYNYSQGILKNSAQQLANAKELRDLDNQIADSNSVIENLQNQLAVLSEQNLTGSQKLAMIREADGDVQRGLLASLREQRKTIEGTQAIYTQTAGIIAGTGDSLRFQLATIKETARVSQEALRATNIEQLSKLSNQIDTARSQATRQNLSPEEREAAAVLVRNLQSQYDIQKQQLAVDLDRLDAETKLNIAQKVYFDTAKEGLDWQQTSLDYLQRQLDVQKSLSDEALKTYENRMKLRVARRGVDLTESGQQAQEINSAREAYKLAVQESSLKKTMIDLQFALLEAQKDQLTEELRVRRESIDANDPANATRLAQLNATINRLEGIDLSKMTEAAKTAVDRSVENARQTLQVAMTSKSRGGIFGGLQAAVEDAIELRTQRRAAANDNPKPIATGTVVAADTQAAKARFEAAVNPVVKSNGLLVNKITEWIAAVEKALGSAVSRVAPEESANRGATGRVATALEFFVRKGYTENQAAGIVGNLQHESGAGLNPRASNDIGGGHVGIAQWGRARQKDFEEQYGKKLIDATFEEQLEFIEFELRNKERGARKKLVNAISASDAASAFHHGYERPGAADTSLAKRQANARNLVGTPRIVAAPQAVPTMGYANDNNDIKVTAARPGGFSDRQGITGPDNLVAGDSVDRSKYEPKVLTPSRDFEEIKNGLNLLDQLTAKTLENLGQLGPQGDVVIALYEGMTGISSSVIKVFETMGDSTATATDRFTAVAAVAQTALSTVQSAVSASARAKVEAIDQEIAAEQRRDGKSAESVAKIAAMEKKKDEISRKQFNTNKKLMMAQAVIATATGVAQALSYGFPLGPILAGVIGAMGAAQLAIISGTQYQSSATASNSAAATMPSLTIGKRGDSVDLAKQNNNVGGELGYLRGKPGSGSNSSNYSVVGSAYGGALPRGYGNTAYVVGEKGPETIIPSAPITVRPANDNQGNQSVNASINITALDSTGVEDILRNQQGNIISMLRQAANANGSPFMEDVNVSMYSRPNKASKL